MMTKPRRGNKRWSAQKKKKSKKSSSLFQKLFMYAILQTKTETTEGIRNSTERAKDVPDCPPLHSPTSSIMAPPPLRCSRPARSFAVCQYVSANAIAARIQFRAVDRYIDNGFNVFFSYTDVSVRFLTEPSGFLVPVCLQVIVVVVVVALASSLYTAVDDSHQECDGVSIY